MSQVRALVVTGFGTNCEHESAHALRQAGADSVTIGYFFDLIAKKIFLPDYNYLLFPGGFLDGDDLGAAQAAALRWKFLTTSSGQPLREQLDRFLANGGIILGICNGFQLLVKLGLLPALHGENYERQVSLSYNDSGRYEDRWIWLRANPKSPCVFTRGLETIYLPVRHGEGKLIPKDDQTLRDIVKNELIALQYADPATKMPTLEYPHNPNGSPLGIAGLTNPAGTILGLMPHPEAYNDPTNHPCWTRMKEEDHLLGTALLTGGVRYLREH